jgi:hypothetical protein
MTSGTRSIIMLSLTGVRILLSVSHFIQHKVGPYGRICAYYGRICATVSGLKNLACRTGADSLAGEGSARSATDRTSTEKHRIGTRFQLPRHEPWDVDLAANFGEVRVKLWLNWTRVHQLKRQRTRQVVRRMITAASHRRKCHHRKVRGSVGATSYVHHFLASDRTVSSMIRQHNLRIDNWSMRSYGVVLSFAHEI